MLQGFFNVDLHSYSQLQNKTFMYYKCGYKNSTYLVRKKKIHIRVTRHKVFSLH